MANHPNRKEPRTLKKRSKVAGMATSKFSNQHLRQEVLRKCFGDVPVKDAKRDLHVQPTPEDFSNGVPRDPGNCGFSRTCQRAFGSKLVLFLARVAYVDLLDDKGNRVVNRYLIDERGVAIIKQYDALSKNGELPVGFVPSGFTLKAPPPGATLEAIRASSRRDREARREALIKGTLIERKSRGPNKKHKVTQMHVRSSFFRHGTGMVQFHNDAD